MLREIKSHALYWSFIFLLWSSAPRWKFGHGPHNSSPGGITMEQHILHPLSGCWLIKLDVFAIGIWKASVSWTGKRILRRMGAGMQARYASPVCKPGMQARLPRTPSYGIQSFWRILVEKCSSANYSRHQAGFDFQVIYLSLDAFRIERQKGYFGLGMFLRAAGHDWVLATSKFVDFFFLFLWCGCWVECVQALLCNK